LEPLGLFASADALNAGFVTPVEASAMISRNFNDSVTICGLSPFNTYFILQALAASGELDRGLATVQECWGIYLRLGATTTWEIAKPGWVNLIHPTDALPGFAGYTSEAHPWSTGATAWVSQYLAGVRPLKPGFFHYLVAPHIGEAMQGLEARVPVGPGSAVTVLVRRRDNTTANSDICVGVPDSLNASFGTLQVSQVLAERLTGIPTGHGVLALVSHTPTVNPGTTGFCSCGERVQLVSSATAPLIYEGEAVGPVIDPATGLRSKMASFPLRRGSGCYHVVFLPPPPGEGVTEFSYRVNPFPPPEYPADFVGRDEVTSGNWIGTYGSAGYYLMDYDGVGSTVFSLPLWVTAVELAHDDTPRHGPWLQPPPQNDLRALLDPRNSSTEAGRKIGQYCNDPCCPTFAFDIKVSPPLSGQTFQFSFYFVDYDERGRRQTVQLMDLETLDDISPPVLVGPPDFVSGVWLVWQYPKSIRVRMNGIRGDNAVVSAILFDEVNTTAS